VTLGSQAALATANARLFLNPRSAGSDWQPSWLRLPIQFLVTDQSNRLLLANPAAWQVLNLSMDAHEGPIIDQVIASRSWQRC